MLACIRADLTEDSAGAEREKEREPPRSAESHLVGFSSAILRISRDLLSRGVKRSFD